MGTSVEIGSHFANTQLEATRSPVGGLTRELHHVKNNWREEGLPENWRYLDETGFQTLPHVDMLFNSFSEFDKNEQRLEKIRTWLGQTEEDIKGFNIEYLAEGLTFPIFYKALPDEQRLICPLYGDKDVEEIVSDTERRGSVKRAMVDAVKPFLLKATDGSIAVMTSPAGWSGLRMQNGKPIVFPDSQTYIWQKKGANVVGFTIRTDFTLDEHREVIRRLTGEILPESADVCDFVEKVALLKGDENEKIEIHDIVNTMRFVRKDLSDGKQINAYKNRHWNEIYADLLNSDNLWKFDEKTREYVEEFKEYVLAGDLRRRDLEEALAVTVLRIARDLGNTMTNEAGNGRKSSTSVVVDYDNFNYGVVLSEVEKKAGCAGGGGNGSALDRLLNPTKYILSSISPRFGISDEEGFVCPKCGFEAIGPIGNTCPGCKITKEEYAKEIGVVVCD